ncbi:shikimate kinase [Pedobacter sp. JCM 36344]|uniref:shikimate kinase n=1 Tax=Pedobacter sp. JCM 36344 TaxID=3374280 RepID=UPI00397C45AA
MRIFLIGFMGCGKTTLGKKLAQKMSYSFMDLDHELEKAAGVSVSNYFSANGEEAFRILEKDTLNTLDYPTNCIISTGGGTPCFFDNMEFMNRSGITIYVDLPPLALAKRLEYGKHKRPLVANMDEQQLVAFIKEKLEERNPYYERSFLTVNGINITTEQVRNELFQIF